MRTRVFILLFLLPLVWALAGYLAGPFLAGQNPTVQLAERIITEDFQGLTERTLASEAFRATGRQSADLLAEAQRIIRVFRIGGALLGAWCGLMVGLTLLSLTRVRPQETYEIDRAACVSCARCFLSCPRERMRLKQAPGK
jgi:ferredoxin